jgi:predicted ATPase
MTLDENATIVAIKALEFLQRILADVDKITTSKAYESVFTISQVHGFPYTGDQFNKTLFDEAKKFVEKHQDYLQFQNPE